MGRNLLVVDDDMTILEFLQEYLASHGYQVATALDGAGMRRAMAAGSVDLVLLDVNLPGQNGFDLARELRATSNVSIIMLTGRGDDMDKIVGLEIGADDYVAKPFNARELLARIGAVLRRSSSGQIPAPTAGPGGEVGMFEGWRVDFATGRLYSPEGELVSLTTGEFRLLTAFMSHPNHVLSRDQLLDFTSGTESEAFDRSIDIQVMRLRRKIERVPDHPDFIRTVRGVGYIFAVPVEWH